MKIQPAWILVSVMGAIIIILLMTRGCGQPGCDRESVTITVHDTVHGDPAPVSVAPRVPAPQIIIVPEYRDFPVDTLSILNDYFTTRFYSDTLKNDTSMLVVVNDSVRANRISSRGFVFQNRRPTAITTTTTITQNRKEAWLKAYLGVGAAYSPTTKRFGVGPFATFTIRQGAVLTYGYDAVGNSHQVAFGWKLSFRKK